ncbi:MAG: hypothetical protein AABY22_22385 [Nanoarchaeota archaeon]
MFDKTIEILNRFGTNSYRESYVRVLIKGTDFDKCVSFSRIMWAKTKKGQWGRGLINDEDPFKAQRIGAFGEMAFSKVLKVPVNFIYREFGQNEDFILLKKYLVDVKTSNGYPRSNSGLIRAYTNTGKKLPIKCHFYIFAYLESEDPKKREAIVNLVGFEKRNRILKREVVNAEKGDHYNYKIPYSELKSIKKFFTEYNTKISSVK